MKYLILVMLLTCGCTWYKNEDTISDGNRKITKTSSSSGVIKSVQAPVHAESVLGDSTVGATSYSQSKGTPYVLYWFGGLGLLAAAVIGIWLGRIYLALAIAAGSIAILACAAYPWFPLLICTLALCGGVYWVGESYFKVKLKVKEKALKQVVSGIERVKAAIPTATEQIHNGLAASMDSESKTIVKKIK